MADRTIPRGPDGLHGWPWTLATADSSRGVETAIQLPKISVVMPSFNQAKFIEASIRSVLLQNYPNLEFILLDGGSNDGTVEIIEKYSPWITHWRSRKDEGQSAAINEGMERATGDILAWLNSDDCYMPGTLFRVARAMRSKLTIVVGAALIANEFATETELVFKQPSFQEMLFEGHLVPQPSTFWTAALWKISGPLKKNFHYVMDYDLWMRMFPAADNIAYCSEPLALIHNHAEQKTQPRTYKQIQVEKFLAVAENLSRLGLNPATFCWRKWRHVRKQRTGLFRYCPLPRRTEIAGFLYPLFPQAAISLVARS